jgi:type 1 glutamine amidotransferase
MFSYIVKLKNNIIIKVHHRKIFLFFTLFLLCFSWINMNALTNDKINALLLSGRNNHNWEETTPFIHDILEDSGRFKVTVTDDPERLDPLELAKYDVILSNWNTWPDVTGQRWSADLEKAFLEFIASGKGFVVVHAGSSTLQDWPEFQKIAGGTWGKGLTGHGPIHTFKVGIEDSIHPVTNGMKDFYIKDELWNNTKFHSEIKVLSSAYSTPANKGTGKNEPVVVTTEYEKGRGIYIVLGHNKSTMQNSAWKTLLLRGTEWAAQGKVTIPVQGPWPINSEIANKQSEYFWHQSDTTITLIKNSNIIWQLNNPKIGKSYFHPINTTDGYTLTSLSPYDHPWHYALWFSWKYINGLNYWEEDRNTGLAEGLTEVIKSNVSLNIDFSAQINLHISYHPLNDNEVLSENRTLYVSPPNDIGEYYIDWESEFKAGDKDVILERTPIDGEKGGRRWGGYATLGLRINSKTLKEISLLNDKGLRGLDIHTRPTAWTDISGIIEDDTTKSAGITIFDNYKNPRFPVPGYVINSSRKDGEPKFVYTNPGFLYNGKYTLKAMETLKLRYRIYVHKGIGDLEKLNEIFNNYSKGIN